VLAAKVAHALVALLKAGNQSRDLSRTAPPPNDRRRNDCLIHASSQSPSCPHEKDGFARSDTIKQRREEAHEKRTDPGFKARRSVVERTHSWINRFRKLLVSFEKTEASYVALLSLACAMICWRQTVSIYG
jgi:transposase